MTTTDYDALAAEYGDSVFYLFNGRGEALEKVTIGRGSPQFSHREVAIRPGSFSTTEPCSRPDLVADAIRRAEAENAKDPQLARLLQAGRAKGYIR